MSSITQFLQNFVLLDQDDQYNIVHLPLKMQNFVHHVIFGPVELCLTSHKCVEHCQTIRIYHFTTREIEHFATHRFFHIVCVVFLEGDNKESPRFNNLSQREMSKDTSFRERHPWLHIVVKYACHLTSHRQQNLQKSCFAHRWKQ